MLGVTLGGSTVGCSRSSLPSPPQEHSGWRICLQSPRASEPWQCPVWGRQSSHESLSLGS